MGGILDQWSTRAKERVLWETFSEWIETPSRWQVVIEKWLAKVGLKGLAAERREKRQKKRTWEVRTDKAAPEWAEAGQQKIIQQLQEAKRAANTTAAMAKYADPTEAVAGIFPALWDAGASAVLAAYYHYTGRKVWFSKAQHSKINKYLVTDGVVWLIPVVGDIADFLYRWCKKIGRLFKKHYEDLARQAKEKGVPASVLNDIAHNKDIDEEVVEKRKDGKGEETVPEAERWAMADREASPTDAAEHTEDVADNVSDVSTDLAAPAEGLPSKT